MLMTMMLMMSLTNIAFVGLQSACANMQATDMPLAPLCDKAKLPDECTQLACWRPGLSSLMK